MVARPDLLCVHVKGKKLKITIVCLHGPHSLRPLPEIEAWWDDVTGIVGKLAKHGPILLIGDANAKVEGSTNGTAGTYGAEATDAAGH